MQSSWLFATKAFSFLFSSQDRTKLSHVAFIREAQEKGWMHWPLTRSVKLTNEHPKGEIVFQRNGSSFRENQETPVEKPVDTRRIIITGDSHTDGAVWNNENAANLLEIA
ncbi:MAG: hypothetical protein R3C05_29555 [Pirellulaceae bacterium]